MNKIQFYFFNFIFLLFFNSANSEKIYLLDTLNATVELDWRTVTNIDGQDGWLEETYRSEEDGLNHQAYSVCNVEHRDSDNWLLMPKISKGEANRLFIEVKFSMRSCAEMPAYSRGCKETLRLYGRTVGIHDNLKDKWQEDPHWELIDTIAATSEKSRSYIQTSSFSVNTSHVYFAFRDSGACSSLLYVKIYYHVCESIVKDFVYLPKTITGHDVHSVVSVQGRCIANSSPPTGILQAPTSICRSDGRWEQIGSSMNCDCNPGFVPIYEQNSCSACAIGTYKSERGSTSCLPCPLHSTSFTVGSTECKCDSGYYRSSNESSRAPCTQPPSKPSTLRISELNQTSTTLTWEEPSSLGGRKEIWYTFKCGKCPKNMIVEPRTKTFNKRKLILTNLEPGNHYTVTIFAHNDVSEKSDLKSYEIIEFTTQKTSDLTVGPLRIDAELENGITLAWQSVPNIQNFEIEMRYENISTSTHSKVPYFSFPTLSKRFAYAFRVRAWTIGQGISEWSDPLFYKVGDGIITRNSAIQNGLTVPRNFISKNSYINHDQEWLLITPSSILPWILICLFAIFTFIAVLLIITRRANKNRKQMSDLDVLDTYKQDTMTPDDHRPKSQSPIFTATTLPNTFIRKLNVPLIPVYGTQKSMRKINRCYVDPSTYENPNEALEEFANDIDPKMIQVFRQIGVGEFGEVCCGRLLVDGAYGAVAQVVAVKTLLPGSSEKAKLDFLTEASIMGQFDHENVIHLIGVVTKSEPVMIVTEYMLNGALDKFLRDNDNGSLTMLQLIKMMKGIASGMKYLTDMGYIHRDIAARNILVDDCLTCKIADFGLSREGRGVLEPEYTTNGGKIPIRWTAPEAITHYKYTSASDIWSYGIVMWEICSFGERPYWDWTNHKVINEIHAGYRLPCPMDSPLELHQIMLTCWQMDRHKRPTFSQLLSKLTSFENKLNGIYDHGLENTSLYQSTSNLTGDCCGFTPPSPPTSLPPQLSLEDFLKIHGLGYIQRQLEFNGITTMTELTRMNHSNLSTIGLETEDVIALIDAIRNTTNTQGMASTLVQLRRPNQPSLRHQRSPLLSGASNATNQTFLTNSSTSSSTNNRKSQIFSSSDGFPV